jgi:nicotinamide mononucleotide transporter
MSAAEALAVAVSILGVWLTTKRSLWSFPFSLASVTIYGVIFFRVKLYADVVLQVIFAVTLIYGLIQWLASREQAGEVIVARARVSDAVLATLAGTITSVTLGYLLASRTDAALPWLDSALLAGSLVGSFWSARRLLEQWWVWIVVDVIYTGVYAYKALYLTAALYAAFVALAVYGLRQWQSALARQSAPGSCLELQSEHASMS